MFISLSVYQRTTSNWKAMRCYYLILYTKVKSNVSSGRQNTLHSNSVIKKGYENPWKKIVQSTGLFSRSLSIINIFYYCYYYYSTLGIIFFHLVKNVIITFFLLDWDYPGVTQSIFYNEKLLRGAATFGKLKLWKQFYQTKFMSCKHAAAEKKKRKRQTKQTTACPSPICNIHSGTDLETEFVIAGRPQDLLS